MNQKKTLYLVGLCFLLSCKKDGQIHSDILTQNRKKWEASNIISYKLKENVGCFCPDAGPRYIEVKNKEIISVTDTTGELSDNRYKQYKTVEQLFDFIESILAKKPFSQEIKYDATYGFPTLFSYNLNHSVADDEATITLDSLVVREKK